MEEMTLFWLMRLRNHVIGPDPGLLNEVVAKKKMNNPVFFIYAGK